jgi:Aspartyl protease
MRVGKAIHTLIRGVVAGLLHWTTNARDERLWMESQIDGKLARLYLDTGSEDVWLNRHTVERLGLPLLPVPGDAGAPGFRGRVKCMVTAQGSSLNGHFPVYNRPSGHTKWEM